MLNEIKELRECLSAFKILIVELTELVKEIKKFNEVSIMGRDTETTKRTVEGALETFNKGKK